MEITLDYINQRIAQLESAFNESLVKSEQIKGALQEALFMRIKITETEEKKAE